MNKFSSTLVAAAMAAGPATAGSGFLDFEDLVARNGLSRIDAPVVSDGAALTPIFSHFNVSVGDPARVSGGQTSIGVQTGAGGSGLRITFPEPIDVLGLDVPAWSIALRGTPDATLSSSAGDSVTIGFAATGPVDLSARDGFRSIDWIMLTMPDPDEACVTLAGGVPFNCSGVFIDRVALAAPLPPAPVPLPAAFWPLAGAVGLLGCVRGKRRKGRPAPENCNSPML